MSSFTREEVPVAIQDDNAELRTVEGGDMTIAFMTLKKGANFGPALVGLPDDLCQCPHWGYMLKGQVKMTHEGRRGDLRGRRGFLLAARPRPRSAGGLRVRRRVADRRVQRGDPAHPRRRIARCQRALP